MTWYKKLSAKITAQFFKIEYGESPKNLLIDNPPINQMTFYNPDQSPESTQLTASLVASQLLKHMDALSLPLEANGSWSDALSQLITIMNDGDKPFSDIVGVIDKHLKFIDEE